MSRACSIACVLIFMGFVAICAAATPAPPATATTKAPPATATKAATPTTATKKAPPATTTAKAAPPQQPLLGGDCSTVAPASRMQCVYAALFALQVREAVANGAATRPGATCASVAPGPTREQCLSAWFMQRQLKPGMVGGCGGVAPQYKNSCVADSVIAMQRAGRSAGAAADMGAGAHTQHQMGSMGMANPAAPGAKSMATPPPTRPAAAAGAGAPPK